jgi:adenosylcobinamide-phosphate synthase
MLPLSPYDFDDRLLFIGAALLGNLLLGSLALRKALGLDGLGAYLRHLLKSLEQRLNRSTRSMRERAVRGSVVLLTMLLLTGLVASALSALTATHPFGWLGEALILALFIPQRLLFDEGLCVYRQLRADKLTDARKSVERFTYRDAHNLDEHAVNRTLMEHLATAFADRVLSPLLWYILLGLPGFVASKIITEAGLMLGHETRRHKAYGKAPARLETVINFLPARLAGWVLVLASLFVPKARPSRAIATLATDAHKVHLPRKGQPIAAAAGALGVSLAGPRSVHGFLVKDGWVGKGSAKATATDLRKMLLLFAIACLLNFAAIATLLFLLAK